MRLHALCKPVLWLVAAAYTQRAQATLHTSTAPQRTGVCHSGLPRGAMPTSRFRMVTGPETSQKRQRRVQKCAVVSVRWLSKMVFGILVSAPCSIADCKDCKDVLLFGPWLSWVL